MTSYQISELQEMEKLEIHGRVSRRPDGVTFFWTGSELVFTVSGHELALEIEVPESSLCPWVCLYLNEHLLQRLMLRRGRQTIPVYDHLNYDEPKEIRLIKDSPALLQNALFEGESLYTVHAIATDGEFYPLQHNKEYERKALRIELIGDSITSGEGLFGYPGLITEDLWFFTSQPGLHYGTTLAQSLDADLRVVTQAGWGVYIGYNNRPDYNIPSIYEQLCGVQTSAAARSLGAQEPYDFSSWQPDLIIVNLGTNDAAAFTNPAWEDPSTGRIHKMRCTPSGAPDNEDLGRIYIAAVRFLEMLRKHNPKAHILWCYGMMGDEIADTLRDAVRDHAASRGDALTPASLVAGFPQGRFYSYLPLPDTLPGEFGSVDHPGIPSHQKTADRLLSAIRALGY